MNPMCDLSGQVSVVTGASTGLGLGMAERLAAAGADVCEWGTQTEKTGAACGQERILAGVAEVVAPFGHLDLCFANAAVTGQSRNPPFICSTLENWRQVISINLDGAYLTLCEAAKRTVKQRIGSSPIVALMRGLAVELARYRTRSFRGDDVTAAHCGRKIRRWQRESRVATGASRRTGPGVAVYLAVRHRPFAPTMSFASTGAATVLDVAHSKQTQSHLPTWRPS